MEAYGYTVEEETEGRAGSNKAAIFKPDLLIVDIGLPDILDVVRQIKEWLASQIIILTVHDQEQEKIEGADDYITKPFGMEELMARIRYACAV